MILDKIVQYKKSEVARAKGQPLPILKSTKKRDFKKAIAASGISLIAEVKKASPSKGVFRETFDPALLALEYETAGASALSVLTDEKFFQGSLNDLQDVSIAVKLPVLRKDFIIDEYQIYEAKYFGADAVLLIAAILQEKQLKSFRLLAEDLGLDVLVEVHSKEELASALASGAEIIGINNRDLKTFETDIFTTIELAELVPKTCLLVSESGIFTGEDVKQLASAGVDAILVGEALVTSDNINNKIRELLGR